MATVTIPPTSHSGQCSPTCPFRYGDGEGLYCEISRELPVGPLSRIEPGPECPGPGRYELVRKPDRQARRGGE